MDEFVAHIESIGFRRAGSRRGAEWIHQATPYLTFAVHPQDDGTVLFTWELAIGELMAAHGLQIGSNETLNLFLFPQHDVKGPAEIEFVVSEMERARLVLSSLDLAAGA